MPPASACGTSTPGSSRSVGSGSRGAPPGDMKEEWRPGKARAGLPGGHSPGGVPRLPEHARPGRPLL
jgi:hypothetical protein